MKSVPFLVQHERKGSIHCSLFCSPESPALKFVCLSNTKATHPDLGAYTGKHTPELEEKGQCIGPGTRWKAEEVAGHPPETQWEGGLVHLLPGGWGEGVGGGSGLQGEERTPQRFMTAA